MMHLKEGTSLQGGRYRIEKVLGQGGFGITYLGIQVGLNRQVAIKEFFMKEYCNREEETSHVSVPSMGSKDLVECFRQKFLKEAQSIAALDHPNIIRIYDVFQENGTAYYVMEYHDHGSLSELVKFRGKLAEADAVGYIRQMAGALQYIHGQKIAHLDIKPGNVLLDSNGHAVLIDFGMSKHYDEEGDQTSTHPAGVSHGYAPLEQYKKGGVATFSPASDIYSLGATLYKLMTGVTPPDAIEVEPEELSASLSGVSAQTRKAIFHAMQQKSKDRPQSVDEFLSLLDVSEAGEVVVDDERTVIDVVPPASDGNVKPEKWWPLRLVPWIAILIAVLGIFGLTQIPGFDSDDDVEPIREAKSEQTEVATTGTINGHAWIDLGLSVKWATMNVGAGSPGDYGDYFAWGEVNPKSEYTETNSQTYEEVIVGNISGNSRYDAARYHWGSSWRLPTDKELEELREKCRWIWSSEDGHSGYMLVGPNGNSIFLPAGGYRYSTSADYVGTYGCYWSGSPPESDTQSAYALDFGVDRRPPVDWRTREVGRSVRPVSD